VASAFGNQGGGKCLLAYQFGDISHIVKKKVVQ
jgi:hypothetical protein